MSNKHISNLCYNDIEKMMNKTVRIKEKENYGEVFTNPILINEMLDTLPKAVWSNPNLIWLDSSSGVGNFFAFCYFRLMKGLKHCYTNPEQRSNHIIEKMFYMVEINENNYKESRILFGEKANIYNNNFLDVESLKTQIYNKKFDIILGNPPYNENGTKHKGNKNIYVFFSLNSLKILKQSGYLLLIHPSAWRLPDHKIQQTKTNLNRIYTNLNIIYINMRTANQTKSLMNILMNVDIILIQNTKNMGLNTMIKDTKDITSFYKIEPDSLICNYGFTILEKIKLKINKSVKFHLTSEKHAQIHNTGPNINIHGISKRGVKVRNSETPHSQKNIRKLIINAMGTYNYIYYDKDGEYGMTQVTCCVLEPSQNTLKLINSKLFFYLSNATKIIRTNFNKDIGLFLPEIDDVIILDSCLSLYKYFNFDSNEIFYIENTEIPKYKNIILDKTQEWGYKENN